jgi:hypothetical protein
MSGKKIEVEVPDGYKLIQDGLEIKFVHLCLLLKTLLRLP